MSKPIDIIEDALRLLNVSSSFTPSTSEQQNQAFSAMVDMMSTWENGGIWANTYVPESITEEMDEPTWFTPILKHMLAKNVAPYFQATISASLNALIEKSEASLQIAVEYPGTKLPSTLPLGQGNRFGRRSRAFFNGTSTAS